MNYKAIKKSKLENFFKNIKFKTIPMKHQYIGLYFAIKENLNSVMFWLGVGTGKTKLALDLCLLWKVKKILVICPNSVTKTWIYETKKHSDFKAIRLIGTKNQRIERLNKKRNIYIINYEGLKVLYSKLINERFDCIIADECFPYNQKVFTNKGEIEIGKIVEDKKKVKVLTYNHKTKFLEWKKIRKFIKNPITNETEFVKINHENGNFACTLNHKIYIKDKGYIQAKSLINLFSCKGESYEKNINLLSMRKKVYNEILAKISFRKRSRCKSILFQKMLGNLEMQTAGISKNVQGRTCEKIETGYNQIKKRKQRSVGKKIQSFFRKNEKEQPHVQFRNAEKGIRKKSWKAFFDSWWKRQNTNTPIDSCYCFKLENGNTRKNKTCIKGAFTCLTAFTRLLQNRYRKQKNENRNRSRWAFPQFWKTKIFRQKKRNSVKFSRLESFKIYKQRSIRRPSESSFKNKYIYNLEIEDNHNYFINNILVSNCHYVKSKFANRTIMTNRLCRQTKKKIFLTGTPIATDEKDLWAEYWCLDNGFSLGNNYWRFLNTYFYKSFYDWKPKKICSICGNFYISLRNHLKEKHPSISTLVYHNKYKNERTIQELILNRITNKTLRYETEECLDLPEKVYLKYYAKMTKRQKKDTLKFISERYNELTEANVLTKTIRLSQITGGFLMRKKNINIKKHKLKELIEEGNKYKSAEEFVNAIYNNQITSVSKAPNPMNQMINVAAMVQDAGFLDAKDFWNKMIKKKIYTYKKNPKLDLLLEVLESIKGKCIIFHRFTREAEIIEQALDSKKINYASVRGSITGKEREKEFNKFKNNSGCNILISHPKCGGEGINLQHANYVIFYSNNYEGATTRIQAENRVHRVGQNKKCFIVDLVIENSIDEQILDIGLSKKEKAKKVLNYISKMH